MKCPNETCGNDNDNAFEEIRGDDEDSLWCAKCGTIFDPDGPHHVPAQAQQSATMREALRAADKWLEKVDPDIYVRSGAQEIHADICAALASPETVKE